MTTEFKRKVEQAAQKAGWSEFKPQYRKTNSGMETRAFWWVSASDGIMTASQIHKRRAEFAIYSFAAHLLGVKS